jgi:hypothetical protein
MILNVLNCVVGVPTGTRTQSSGLGGRSFIQLNYGDITLTFYFKHICYRLLIFYFVFYLFLALTPSEYYLIVCQRLSYYFICLLFVFYLSLMILCRCFIV